MAYVLMLANFWFVCFCFTIMFVPKKYLEPIDTVLAYDNIAKSSLSAIELCIFWPIIWYFAYEKYKEECAYKQSIDDVDSMFLKRFSNNEAFYRTIREKE